MVGGQTNFSYTGISKPVSNYNDGALGADLKLDTNTTIGASISYWGGGNTNQPHNYGYYQSTDGPALAYNSFFNNSAHAGSGIANLYLDKSLAGEQTIRADVDYLYYDTKSLSNSQSSFTDSQGNQAGSADSLFSPVQRDFGNTVIKVLVGKLDYSKQLNKKIKLEAGAKSHLQPHRRQLWYRDNFENGRLGARHRWGLANNFITYETIDAGYACTFNMQLDSVDQSCCWRTLRVFT